MKTSVDIRNEKNFYDYCNMNEYNHDLVVFVVTSHHTHIRYQTR